MSAAPVEKMIDDVVTKNEPPPNLKEGDLWAEYTGILKIGDAELVVHVLNNGQRIIDKESLEKFFGGIL